MMEYKFKNPRPPGRLLSGWTRSVRLVLAVLLVGLLLILVNIYQLRALQADHSALHGATVEGSPDRREGRRGGVWVQGRKLESGYLKHVFAVFERLGYQRVGGAVQGTDWDVLWAHDYPFVTLREHLSNLKPHQRVNHFPGSGFVTNKVSLATSSIGHIPKAFAMPHQRLELESYAQAHPDAMWVQKSSSHRGIKIRTMEELELGSENTFVQQYIDKPYLIGGHRFDIGLYTTLVSIDPLRVYVYDGDWLVRFCPEKYEPFDPERILKYVVTDDYLPIWKVEELQTLYVKLDYNKKETLLAQVRQTGLDAGKLQREMYAAIKEVYLDKEADLIQAANKYSDSNLFNVDLCDSSEIHRCQQVLNNFFEMVRFDFVLDEELNVFLMEVNMSPNLSSGHFAPNKLLYEQVVFSMLSLVGVGHLSGSSYTRSEGDEARMQVASKNLHVYADQCVSTECQDNCRAQVCKLCSECLKTSQTASLSRAYLEHSNRLAWRRVFPTPLQTQAEALAWDYAGDEAFNNLSMSNAWMTLWFRGQCLKDSTWCS